MAGHNTVKTVAVAAVAADVDEYEPETAEDRQRVCKWRLQRTLLYAMTAVYFIQFAYCCWLLNRLKPVCPNAGMVRMGFAAECAEPYCAYNCPNECKCQVAIRYRAPSIMSGFAICFYAGLAGGLFALFVNPCGIMPDPTVPRLARGDRRASAEGFTMMCSWIAEVLVLATTAVCVARVGTDDANWVPYEVSVLVLALTAVHFTIFCAVTSNSRDFGFLSIPYPERKRKIKPPQPVRPQPAAAPIKSDATATASAAVTGFPLNKCPDFDTTKHPQPQPPSDAAASDKASALIIVAPPPDI